MERAMADGMRESCVLGEDQRRLSLASGPRLRLSGNHARVAAICAGALVPATTATDPVMQ